MSFSTVAYAALDMSVLQQPVLPLDLPILQQPVLHLDLPVLKYGAPFLLHNFFSLRSEKQSKMRSVSHSFRMFKKYFSHLFTSFFLKFFAIKLLTEIINSISLRPLAFCFVSLGIFSFRAKDVIYGSMTEKWSFE